MNTQPKVLVVDDLPDWRRTLSGLLAEEGYDVLAAGSLVEATNLLESGHFDLALLDVRLDESDDKNTEGLTLATEIGLRWPTTKVIVITGYDTPAIIKKTMEPDAKGKRLVADFLPKAETGELIQVAKRVLAQ
jgi:CheY-like chemotaxis protein